MPKKCVLAFSGGLDTSVAVKWIQDTYGVDVIALTIDFGQEKNPHSIKNKAKSLGAKKTYFLQEKENFVKFFVTPAIMANALYQGKYPLSTALGRFLIAKALVEVAQKEGAEFVAHGCTGKGNDQVRLDVAIKSLDPSLKIIAPAREWDMNRESELEYARKHGIQVLAKDFNHNYSTDENLWGRSIEGGILENLEVEPPEDAFKLTSSIENAPEKPETISIGFEQGIPVKLNDEKISTVKIIEKLNAIAGKHGIGRIDHVEDRHVGIKTREIYECPAAVTIIALHKELESIVLPKESLSFKNIISEKFSELIYNGFWFSSLLRDISAYLQSNQRFLTGTIKAKLHKGNIKIISRESKYSLYSFELATYGRDDKFDHKSAVGFIDIVGKPIVAQMQRQLLRIKEKDETNFKLLK